MDEEKIEQKMKEKDEDSTGKSFTYQSYDQIKSTILNNIVFTGDTHNSIEGFKSSEIGHVPISVPEFDAMLSEEESEHDPFPEMNDEGEVVEQSDVVFVRTPNSRIYATRLSIYNDLNPSNSTLRSAIVYDLGSNRTIHHSPYGGVSDTIFGEIDVDDIMDRLTSNEDLMTGEYISNSIEYTINKYKTKEVEIPKNSLIFTSDCINMLRTNPRDYKKIRINNEKAFKKLSQFEIEELLLFYLIWNPEHIPEVFTIIENEPSSDLMKVYLKTLADSISAEMDLNDEIGDLEKLEAEAYKASGYKEDFESIKELAKQYNDYFKYCLVKNENYLVTKQKLKELSEIADEFSENGFVKRYSKSRNKADIVELFKQFTSGELKDTPYILKDSCHIYKHDSNNNEIYVNFFKKFDGNMIDFPKKVDKILMNKISIINQILFKEGRKKNPRFYIIVIDKNNACYPFEVKQSTIKKWRNELSSDLDKACWHLNNNSYDLPYEFMQEQPAI